MTAIEIILLAYGVGISVFAFVACLFFSNASAELGKLRAEHEYEVARLKFLLSISDGRWRG